MLRFVAIIVVLGVLAKGQSPCCPAAQFRVQFSGQMGIYDESSGEVEATRRFSDISVDSSDPDDYKYRSNRLIFDIYTNQPRTETIHARGDRQYRYNDTHCERQPFRRAPFSQCITDEWQLVGSNYLGVGEHTINFHAWRMAFPGGSMTMTVSDNCVLMGLDFAADVGPQKMARANVITGYTTGPRNPRFFDLPDRCANL